MLINPSFGLVFWTTITFILVFLVLRKFAWKPIINAIKKREETIASALEQAELVRKEMAEMQAQNEILLQKAREERDAILSEARQIKDKIIAQAQQQAREEANNIIENARLEIINEKHRAIEEIRVEIADISLNIAQKVLEQELQNPEVSKKIIEEQIEKINFN
jgi:F-type H+-transporting ATPase subunit b